MTSSEPRPAASATMPRTSSSTRGRSRRIRRAVNALLTRPRSRVWSGGSSCRNERTRSSSAAVSNAFFASAGPWPNRGSRRIAEHASCPVNSSSPSGERIAAPSPRNRA